MQRDPPGRPLNFVVALRDNDVTGDAHSAYYLQMSSRDLCACPWQVQRQCLIIGSHFQCCDRRHPRYANRRFPEPWSWLFLSVHLTPQPLLYLK